MSASSIGGPLGRRLAGLAAAALVAVATAPAPAPAQSGSELLQQALERYEAQTEGIESYTVVHQMMGMEQTQRYVRTEVDGHPVFVPEGSAEGATGEMNPWAMFPKLAERASVQGTETVDGVESHVLRIDDVEGLGLGGAISQSGQMGGFTPETMTLYLGTEDYLVRRMMLEGQAQTQMGTQDVTFVANLRDYRQVEGMYHPFRMEMSIQGLSSGMSDEEKQKARQQLEQLEEQMQSMPEQQRAQMEKILKPQMEKLRKMLDSGRMEFSMTVQEVRVNTPPSGEGSGGG